MFAMPEPTFGSVRRLRPSVERGTVVSFAGRPHVVVGFDPMSVLEPLVYLEDAETGERRSALLADVSGESAA
jgi:hypothetical protein